MILFDSARAAALVSATVFGSDNPQGESSVGVYSTPSAFRDIELIQADLADCKMRLFQAGLLTNITPATPLSEYVAAEATYSGYTAGGIAIEEFNDPIAVGSGAEMVSPLVQFNFVAPGVGTPVENTIGGWFLVTAGGALVIAGEFEDGVPMVDNTSGIPIAVALRLGNM